MVVAVAEAQGVEALLHAALARQRHHLRPAHEELDVARRTVEMPFDAVPGVRGELRAHVPGARTPRLILRTVRPEARVLDVHAEHAVLLHDLDALVAARVRRLEEKVVHRAHRTAHGYV